MGTKWSKPQAPSNPSSSTNRTRATISSNSCRCWAMSIPKRMVRPYSRHADLFHCGIDEASARLSVDGEKERRCGQFDLEHHVPTVVQPHQVHPGVQQRREDTASFGGHASDGGGRVLHPPPLLCRQRCR